MLMSTPRPQFVKTLPAPAWPILTVPPAELDPLFAKSCCTPHEYVFVNVQLVIVGFIVAEPEPSNSSPPPAVQLPGLGATPAHVPGKFVRLNVLLLIAAFSVPVLLEIWTCSAALSRKMLLPLMVRPVTLASCTPSSPTSLPLPVTVTPVMVRPLT